MKCLPIQLFALLVVLGVFLSSAWAQGGPGGGGNGPGPGGGGNNGPQFRSIDGSDNNQQNPDWGRADTEFPRVTTLAYGDGVGTPSGATRPSARHISNVVVDQLGDLPNSMGVSDFVWQWGQFLDHDIDLTPILDPPEHFDIPVPAGDIHFDPTGTGTATIPLERSFYNIVNGVRQQVNAITSYIDASNVYGSDDVTAQALRTLDGTGRLQTSAGDLLPIDPITGFFLAGDERANEQVGLTSMHTLFVREHNYRCGVIAQNNPQFNGEQIYQRARRYVAAQMQVITYRDFLPILLGPNNGVGPYQGYRPNVEAAICNVFATAAYRFGHTMLSSTLLRLDAQGNEIAAGNLSLASAFFDNSYIHADGIEPILRGLSAQRAQEVDPYLIDEVRNFLFGPPGSGGFDLASLNIQRGRDHGLPSYNQVRLDYGLPAVTSFAQISTDVEVQTRLQAAYGSVADIDPWVGLLSEDHVPGGLLGETAAAIIREQFRVLRDGDRFWYQRDLPNNLENMVESETLADIIRRNTSIGQELPDDVFFIQGGGGPGVDFTRGDCNGDGAADIGDAVSMLQSLFGGAPASDCADACDVNDDGTEDIADPVRLLAFLFGGGLAPNSPYQFCGDDPTPDALSCNNSNCP